MKQGTVAASCNISQTYLSLIESDRRVPNMDTLVSLCEALDVPLPILMLYSLEESDIPEDKIRMFSDIKLPAQNLLTKILELQKK